MSFSIGTAVFNANSTTGGSGTTDISVYATNWQVQTCGDVPANVGAPLQALRVVAINKLQASICNPRDIIGRWNTPDRIVLTDGQKYIVPADSVHSVAFKVVSGNGTIQLGAAAAQAIDAGEADAFTASELLDTAMTFNCIAGKIVINTIGPAPAP